MTFFLCLFVFGQFLKTTFLIIRDNGNNYSGKTMQGRDLKFSPVFLWNVPGAISYFGCYSFISRVCKQR